MSLNNGNVNVNVNGRENHQAPANGPKAPVNGVRAPALDLSPDKVEESLVEESRKAGVPAFKFDPDAPPEAKASAAKSVCSPLRVFNAPAAHR